MKAWAPTLQRLQKGFTIIELLVVIVIIGVIATIIIVGYSSVASSANDTSIKDDLTKVSDAFKLFKLDNGSFPDTEAELATTGVKVSSQSYATTTKANLYICVNADSSEFAAIAMSKSTKRFVVKSESGLSDYTGTVVWDASTGNWSTTCSSINSSYVPLTGNVTGMVDGSWATWVRAQ